jgi:hypothetical protein
MSQACWPNSGSPILFKVQSLFMKSTVPSTLLISEFQLVSLDFVLPCYTLTEHEEKVQHKNTAKAMEGLSRLPVQLISNKIQLISNLTN